MCFGLHFFYELAIQIDIITIQPVFYLIFLPASYAIGPILYLYNKSLLARKFYIKPQHRIHFVISVIVFFVSVAMQLYYGSRDFGIIISNYGPEDLPRRVNFGRILFLLLKTTLFYIHLLVYYFLIGRDQTRHKKRYGKYYADYEKRNEKLLFRIFLCLLGVIVTQLIIQVLQLDINIVTVLSNLLSAVLISLIFFAGKKQIEIRKYRMYKLSSHEHQIKD